MHNIRNFSIIAHVDHGKSTLSDRFIQICGAFDTRKMGSQILDSMDLERERGITIKAQSVTLNYRSFSGQYFQLNLIDTPGHVDFSYEVSRSLSACEGALLLVDAVQGIGAQTISHYHIAKSLNLEVILVINKIDLSSANPCKVLRDVKNILDIDISNALLCSAKTGIGVSELLENLLCRIPSPQGEDDAPLQALIIDSWFDNYLGVVSLVRIKNGTLRQGDKVILMSTGDSYFIDRLGILTPQKVDRKILRCGEVGWLTCATKNIIGIPVGDTLTLFLKPAIQALPGFKRIKPHIYATIFSLNSSSSYEAFRIALVKLSLNDSSLSYEPEISLTFGCGFKCGFLGLLHMEIVKERLEREYALDLIITAPMINYEILTVDNQIQYVNSPSRLLSMDQYIKEIREPIVECNILSPKRFFGGIASICAKKRGMQINVSYFGDYVNFVYEIPMSEVLLNLFDQIKSESHGYASLEYEFKRFSCANIVCIKLLINGNYINELSLIMHRKYANYHCRILVNKLQELIPRQQFDVVIQAAISNRVIARAIVKQLRKDVLVKCHGRDISRKKKLLKKQKKGKKRMKQLGNIMLPQDIFLTIFNVEKN
ncbi:translation elongation factor 4 [Blochmannia endosymbiont of Camponotus (Colobopsis) obliquus]|uniref:translation elongation factor 4 n=1 Tax=Blochmannia endosymbiont of Camponotus (Colobopsis) obliquus TaxID=1505597 RepID=UPI00061A5487|nr:translation elongation factor 4 [Blochmannia endosymbiont of Camponotus (Colobopsis) obliquus]AKC60691.1 Elongation factor 4 [Blochmannia endosymbiont of Camponotus (Colobopsis) obliquus]